MAKFKCKDTGCVYEFIHEHDIVTMRSHHQYEEVLETAPVTPAKETQAKSSKVVKDGNSK